MQKSKIFKTILTALLIYFAVVYFLLQPKFGPQFERSQDRFDENNLLDLNFDSVNSDKESLNKDDLNEDQLLAFDALLANHSLSDQLIIKSVDEEEYSDTSLGCPSEDSFYSQVITPGFKFVLEDENGETLDYRISKDLSTFANCSSIK